MLTIQNYHSMNSQCQLDTQESSVEHGLDTSEHMMQQGNRQGYGPIKPFCQFQIWSANLTETM